MPIYDAATRLSRIGPPLDPIPFGDPRWADTFPQRVLPLPGEWLRGLLLRCDRANGWPAGSASGFLTLRQRGAGDFRGRSFVSGIRLPLGRLAELLGAPLAPLEATLFDRELTGIYGVAAPSHTWLNPRTPFRVCPACVAAGGFVARWAALPGIAHCPAHGLRWVDSCSCGSPLHPADPAASPFRCRCGHAWSSLPAEVGAGTELALDARLLALYEHFFARGNPALLALAHATIRRRLRERGWRAFPEAELRGIRLPTRPPRATFRRSLAVVVACLAILDCAAEDVTAGAG